jgi:hypothetical protein
LLATGHLIRFAFSIPISIGGMEVPLWVSLPAAVILGALGVWLWIERTR